MQHEINKKRGCTMHPLPASRYKVHNISAIRIVNPFFSYDLADISSSAFRSAIRFFCASIWWTSLLYLARYFCWFWDLRAFSRTNSWISAIRFSSNISACWCVSLSRTNASSFHLIAFPSIAILITSLQIVFSRVIPYMDWYRHNVLNDFYQYSKR